MATVSYHFYFRLQSVLYSCSNRSVVFIENSANGINAQRTRHWRQHDSRPSHSSMDEDSGKLVGPNIENNDAVYLWYYFCFPVIVFIRMAQTLFSIARLLIGLLLNDESAWCTIHCLVWMIIDASILFCLELSSLFRWLVWISSIVNLMIIERYVGLIYSLFLMLLCDKRLKTEQFSRQYRRNTHLCTLGTSDERLMLLSGIRIYASLALFTLMRCIRCSPFGGA